MISLALVLSLASILFQSVFSHSLARSAMRVISFHWLVALRICEMHSNEVPAQGMNAIVFVFTLQAVRFHAMFRFGYVGIY